MDKDHKKDFTKVIQFLAKSDDRVLAIVSMAYCDRYLGELIKAKMPGAGSELRQKLFSPEGLLGPFGARIDLARALRLITPALAKDLMTMASIRNKFAHNIDIGSFDHPEITERIDNFKVLPMPDGDAPRELRRMVREQYAAFNYRDKFAVVGFNICKALHDSMEIAIQAGAVRG